MTLVFSRRSAVAGLLALLTAALFLTVSPPETANAKTAAKPQVFSMPATGSITVTGKGNGHGHGMSQYGAQGAALKGLSASSILRFYYPGTTLRTLPISLIRVLLSNTGLGVFIAPSPGLVVSGVGAVPTTGVQMFRLLRVSYYMTLQKQVGGRWSNIKSGLPSGTTISRPAQTLRIYHPDQTSTIYRGSITAITNSNSALSAINVTHLNWYTMGVVPRESPSYWAPAALQAQAVAARSYGRNAVESHSSSSWDICDTNSCQVYGGMEVLDASGNELYGETDSTNAAVSATNDQVLQTSAGTIFAQFSASDGGYTAAGGYSYLPAKPDPYDDAASGDPYLSWTRTIPVATIAAYFGLAKVTQLVVTQRDGNGTWGGRIMTMTVNGTNSAGHSASSTAYVGTVESFFGGGRSNLITFTP